MNTQSKHFLILHKNVNPNISQNKKSYQNELGNICFVAIGSLFQSEAINAQINNKEFNWHSLQNSGYKDPIL